MDGEPRAAGSGSLLRSEAGIVLACLVGGAGFVALLYTLRHPTWDEVRAEFEAEYGIRIETGAQAIEVGRTYGILGETPEDFWTRAAGHVVVEELREYTPALLAKVGIERVLLLDSLANPNDEEIGGWALPEAHAICIGVRSAAPLVVHHEVFHMIDAQLADTDLDFHWVRANPRGFSYGLANVENIDRERWSDPSLAIDGFFTPYATTGFDEDQAEVHAHLVARGSSARREAEADPVLARKVELIDAALAELSDSFR